MWRSVWYLVWVGRWSSQLWSGLDSGRLIYLWTFSGIIGACIASPFLLFIRIFIIISTRWIQMVSPIVAVVVVILLLILLQTRIIVCEVLLANAIIVILFYFKRSQKSHNDHLYHQTTFILLLIWWTKVLKIITLFLDYLSPSSLQIKVIN